VEGRPNQGFFQTHRTIAPWLLMLGLMLLCCFVRVSLASAHTESTTQVHDLRISETRLDKALAALAKQTESQLLFPYEMAQTLTVHPVEGRYTITQALGMLLEGTPLDGRLTPDGVITVFPARSHPIKDLSMPHANVSTSSSLRKTPLAAMVGLMLATGATSVSAQQADKLKELDEIVVTADRRGEQKPTETPLAITAYDGGWLADRGYSGVKDFIQYTPGASITEFMPGLSRIQMRGISAGVGENNIGYYLDEVPLAFINQNNLPDLRAFDMDRIEVLRGPQGTLYGAGALAGVVRAITQAPDLTARAFKLDTELSSVSGGGTGNAFRVAANQPLAEDVLGIRAVYSREDNAGWIDQTKFGENDYNSSEIQNLRLKMLANITDQLNLSTMYWGSRVEAQGSPNSMPGDVMNETARMPSQHDYDILNLTLNYDGDRFGLVSATSLMDMDSLRRSDFILGHTLDTHLDPKAFTQEVRAYSTHDGDWQWSAGAYLRDAEQSQEQNSEALKILKLNPVLQHDTVESRSVFGEITRRFLDRRLEATLGLRYLHETRSSEQRLRPTAPYSNTFNVTTPRLNISYHPSADRLVYFNYSEGFRSGINQYAVSLETAQALGVPLPSAARPEYADSYELGYKAELFDNRLVLEATGFYIKGISGAASGSRLVAGFAHASGGADR